MKKIPTLIFITALVSTQLYAQTCNPNIVNNWQDGRYTDNGDHTITDTQTNLIWKKCAEGLSGDDCATGSATIFTWQQALALGGSSFAGRSDWRLPNIKELASLAALNCYQPSININRFPNTPADDFWSSSPNAAYAYYAWRLHFGYGYGNDDIRDYYDRVRLVRSGQ